MNATVVNKQRGEVDLQLAGKTYTFKLGTRALSDAQELLSTPRSLVSLDEMRAGMIAGRLKYITAVMWAGLQKFHPGTTPEQVDDILDACDESDVQSLMRSLGVTMVPTEADSKELSEGAPANPQKAQTRKRGTGVRSSSKPAA